MYDPYKYATNGKVAGNILDPDGPVLRLDDGTLNLQNLPVVPLLFRGVDAIIANDNSGGATDMWPNGTALYATMQWARRNGLQFPGPTFRLPMSPSLEDSINDLSSMDAILRLDR